VKKNILRQIFLLHLGQTDKNGREWTNAPWTFEAKKIYGRQPFRLAIRSFSEGWWWSNKLNLQSLYAQNSERFLRMTANSSLTKSSQKFSIKQKSIDTCYSVSNQLSSN
jgi:hypothetical protein